MGGPWPLVCPAVVLEWWAIKIQITFARRGGRGFGMSPSPLIPWSKPNHTTLAVDLLSYVNTVTMNLATFFNFAKLFFILVETCQRSESFKFNLWEHILTFLKVLKFCCTTFNMCETNISCVPLGPWLKWRANQLNLYFESFKCIKSACWILIQKLLWGICQICWAYAKCAAFDLKNTECVALDEY